MEATPNLVVVAALIADPSRATMLAELERAIKGDYSLPYSPANFPFRAASKPELFPYLNPTPAQNLESLEGSLTPHLSLYISRKTDITAHTAIKG